MQVPLSIVLFAVNEWSSMFPRQDLVLVSVCVEEESEMKVALLAPRHPATSSSTGVPQIAHVVRANRKATVVGEGREDGQVRHGAPSPFHSLISATQHT